MTRFREIVDTVEREMEVDFQVAIILYDGMEENLASHIYSTSRYQITILSLSDPLRTLPQRLQYLRAKYPWLTTSLAYQMRTASTP